MLGSFEPTFSACLDRIGVPWRRLRGYPGERRNAWTTISSGTVGVLFLNPVHRELYGNMKYHNSPAADFRLPAVSPPFRSHLTYVSQSVFKVLRFVRPYEQSSSCLVYQLS